jgi:hypothetical protein
MKYIPLYAFALTFLTSCGSTPKPPEPVIITQEVRVPVTIPCPVEMPAEPSEIVSDQELKDAPDAAARYQLLASERAPKNVYIRALRDALSVCKE